MEQMLDNGRYQELCAIAQKENMEVGDLLKYIVDSHLENRPTRLEAIQGYDTLTEREKNVHWNLYRFRLMTREQVGNIYSNSPHNESANNYAGECLQTLVQHDLAERHILDFKPPGRRTSVFYSLTELGVYIGEVLRRGPRGINRVRRPFPPELLTPHWFPHHLDLVDVGVSFASVRNEPYGELLEWEHDGDFSFKFPWKGSLRRLRPDAKGLWYPKKSPPYSFILELVRSRGQFTHLKKIVKTYIYFWESGAFVREEGSYIFPLILFIASRTKTYGEILRAITHGVRASRIDTSNVARHIVIGLAQLEDLTEFGPFSQVWVAPLQGKTNLRFSDLYSLLLNNEV